MVVSYTVFAPACILSAVDLTHYLLASLTNSRLTGGCRNSDAAADAEAEFFAGNEVTFLRS